MNGEGFTYFDRVESLRKDRRWSEERARREAAEVLGREEVPPLDELPDEDLRKLIAAWERVNTATTHDREAVGP